MKASTEAYIQLQNLYKTRAEEEKAIFKTYLQAPVDNAIVDVFLKNSHALKLLRGKPWGALETDSKALGVFKVDVFKAIKSKTLQRN
jgi:amyloid beta precursor protein binding protein 1